MVNKIKELLVQIRALHSDAEVRQSAIALVRMILQYACIAIAEWLIEERQVTRADNTNLSPLPLNKLRKPPDGKLIECLAELLVAAENEGWNGVSSSFWQPIPSSRPCVKIVQKGGADVENVLYNFVSLRNDSVEGHGIAGNYNRDAELDVVQLLIERMSHILPVINSSNELVLATRKNYKLQLLHAPDGDLICYREIKSTAGGNCLVEALQQKSLFECEKISYEAKDILGAVQVITFPQYDIQKTFNPEWSPFTLIPDRLTKQFTGRLDKLKDLETWANDSDSRACLLYGDGGIGKTTLVVEFIHLILKGEIQLTWKPEIITYYSAKKTCWGLNGLEIIQVRDVGVIDVCHAMLRGFEDKPLDRKWFKNTDNLIQKVASYFKKEGFDRNSHLLILDNTETMAQDEQDTKLLFKQMEELFKKVGRTIITSRRREAVEARQIEIPPFSDDESIEFLRERGKVLNRKQINQAGNPKLRKFAKKLGNKPLVLEVFVQSLTNSSISLDKAHDKVLIMQRQDLGKFLYEDAWNRLSCELKHLLLLMTRVSDAHDDLLLKLCCLQAKVSIIRASDAIEESRGIATILKVSNSLQIIFEAQFLKFCEKRTIAIDGKSCPEQVAIDSVKRRYNHFLVSVNKRIEDPFMLAYRHALARAAWTANKEEKYDDCELFYEEAILEDSDNGWLFDRYAHFLFSRRRFQDALEKSKIATKILNEEPETWFTRGIIEGKLGMTESSIMSLNRAKANGKPEHLCLLQQSYTYLNASPPNIDKAKSYADEFKKKIPKSEESDFKNQIELNRIRSRIGSLVKANKKEQKPPTQALERVDIKKEERTQKN